MFRWTDLSLIIVVAALILFVNLGGMPLLDPDEPVYAETSREMLVFNDFLSPRIYGEYWYDKPPVYYWLVAGTFKLLGISELAARLPAALMALATVILTYFAGVRLFSPRAGLISALALATSTEFFYLGRAAVTDTTLNFFLTACLLAFFTERYYLFYVLSGLAVMTKGPIGLLFPGAIIFLYMLFGRRFDLLRYMKIPAGIALFSITAIPWYWMMYNIHGSAFIETFFGFHNITRFTSPEHPEGILWYYFIPVLILGFFPWTAVLAQSVWTSLTASRGKFRTMLFLNIWAWFIFLFFTVSRTKLVSYILPMFPPLALIAGWYFDRIWELRYKGNAFSWPVMLTILTALLAGGMVYGVPLMPALQTGVYLSAGIFALMTAAVWYFIKHKEYGAAFWTKTVAMVSFAVIVVMMMLPQAAPYFSVREISQDFKAVYDGESAVYVVKFLHPGFSFYSGQYGKEVKTIEDMTNYINEEKRAYFVIHQSEYKRLADKDRVRVKLIAARADKVLLLKE